MKNKILCLLCGMVMAVGLTACGDKNTSEAMKDSTNSNTTQENTQEGEEQPVKEPESKEPEVKLDKDGNIDYWIVKKMEPPEIPTITNVREVSIKPDMTNKVGITPLNYDFQEIEKVLKDNAFLKENYDLASGRMEDFELNGFEEGDFWSCTITDTVRGSHKGTMTNGIQNMYDFYFNIGRDTGYYDNISYVGMVFNDVKLSMDLQEQIFGIMKDTLGQEMAEFMVYGAVEDEAYDSYEILVEAKHSGSDDTDKYLISRSVNIDFEESTADLSFIFRSEYPHYYNRYKCYNGEYEPLINQNKYNFSAITNGGISDFNVNEFTKAAPEYMSIYTGEDYVLTHVSWLEYREMTDDWGGKKYYFTGDLKRGYNEYYEFNDLHSPEFNIEYMIYELQGDIHTIDISFDGDTEEFEIENTGDEAYKRQVLDIVSQQIATVVPGVDISRITYENMENAKNHSVKIDVPYTLLGKECKCVIVVDEYDGWNIDITYGKE